MKLFTLLFGLADGATQSIIQRIERIAARALEITHGCLTIVEPLFKPGGIRYDAQLKITLLSHPVVSKNRYTLTASPRRSCP